MGDSDASMNDSDREEFCDEPNEEGTLDLADPHCDVFDQQMEEEMNEQQEAEEKDDSPGDSGKKKKSGGKKGRLAGAKKWSSAETAYLLELIDQKWYILKTAAKKKPVWIIIADSMELVGYQRNFAACANKWKILRNEYQVCKDSNKISGNSKITGECYQQLDAILGERASTQPPFLLNAGVFADTNDNQEDLLAEPHTPAPTAAAVPATSDKVQSSGTDKSSSQPRKKSRKERRLEEDTETELDAEKLTMPRESNAEKVSRLMGEHMTRTTDAFTSTLKEQAASDYQFATISQEEAERRQDQRWSQFMQMMAMQQQSIQAVVGLLGSHLQGGQNMGNYPQGRASAPTCWVDGCQNAAQHGYDGRKVACKIHRLHDMV